jgi:N-acetylneuraminic acid mutarotase
VGLVDCAGQAGHDAGAPDLPSGGADLGADAPDTSADLSDAGAPDVVDAPDAAPAPDVVDSPDMPPDMGAPQGDRWVSLAPLAGGTRQENGVVALGGEVVVIGGFRGAATLASVEAYDPVRDTWRELSPLPVQLHHPNVAVHQGKIYVLGFLTGGSFVPDGRGFVYDPQEDAWSPVASMPQGTLRGAGVAGVVEEGIMVVGGLRNVAVADVSLYRPGEDRWEALPSLPVGLDHIVGGVVDGVFYAIGGRQRRISTHRTSVYAFCEGAWKERAPMPTSRAGHAAAVWGGQIYVMGGEGNPEDPSGVFDQNEVYDPASDTWSSLSPMLTRRHGTGAAAIDGRIYVPGGADVIAFGSIDILEAYLVP